MIGNIDVGLAKRDAALLLWIASLVVVFGCAERAESPRSPAWQDVTTLEISEVFPVRTGADPEWFLVQVEHYNQSLEEYLTLAPELDNLRAHYGADFEGLTRAKAQTLEHLQQDVEGLRYMLSDIAEHYEYYAREFGQDRLMHFGLPAQLSVQLEPTADRRVDLTQVDWTTLSNERLKLYRNQYLSR